ncbi:hypothetical protein QQF64_009186 [Cirrhinus molitorella]|uniref:Uncharacterized protein n=1 Tax=Cirrhinus molitorella TaxID=172907 RepID=A0ABR3M3I4_9TELE
MQCVLGMTGCKVWQKRRPLLTKLNLHPTSHKHTQIRTGSVNTRSALFALQQANGPNSSRPLSARHEGWKSRTRSRDADIRLPREEKSVNKGTTASCESKHYRLPQILHL